jgi:hypothetical protein
MISKQLYRILLSKEYWYSISDTVQTLKKFVYQIIDSESITSYPISEIQQMYQIDTYDFWKDYVTLFELRFNDPMRIVKFYEHFPNYQYLYMANKTINSKSYCKKSFKGIHLTGSRSDYLFSMIITNFDAVTEIIAKDILINYDRLVSHCSRLEKLEIWGIYNVGHGKPKFTKLKHFYIYSDEVTDEWIKILPNTIESLYIQKPDNMDPSSLFNQLDATQYRNYLKLKNIDKTSSYLYFSRTAAENDPAYFSRTPAENIPAYCSGIPAENILVILP